MILATYIREVGVEKAARRLNANPRTVMSWLYGYRFPRKAKAFEIERETDGLVSFAECFQHPEAQ